MDMNFAVFQEPRGVMRILHVIFSICAFATITSFSGMIKLTQCTDLKPNKDYEFSYPFQLEYLQLNCSENQTSSINGDFSSDAKFFVASGVLAFLYALAISVIYVKFDELYKRNSNIPLADFLITVVFGILWLSSSAAWANGLTGLKYVTDLTHIFKTCCPNFLTPNFSTLNISVVFGFLNFFLWAADLWFLYKETAWFQGAQAKATSGV